MGGSPWLPLSVKTSLTTSAQIPLLQLHISRPSVLGSVLLIPLPQTQPPVCRWEEKHWASELCRDLEMAGACGALEEKARSQAASHLLVVEAVLQTLVALEGAVTGVLNSTRVADLGRWE